MDLRTGSPLWPALSAPQVTMDTLADDVRCEVVVLGAGVSGALAACLLAEAGAEVVVVDRRGPVLGSTPASTALIQYEIDTPLVELAETLGNEAAAAAYWASRQTLDGLAEIVARFGIDCDLRWRGSLFLAEKPDDLHWMKREADARQAIGIEVGFMSHGAVRDRFDINRPGALYSPSAMELDPYKLTQGLLKAAQSQGARLVEAELSPQEVVDGVRHLTTANGPTLFARQLVVATGYETPEQFASVRKYCTLNSTYALATEPLGAAAPWPEGVLIWDCAEPYFYCRTTADGRVVMGGEDEEFADAAARDALLAAKTRLLVEKFGRLRPEVAVAPAFAWCGTFAESPDGLPLIGTLPEYPDCHFALGYGGNGITFSLIAAEIIRDSILKRANEVAGVFRFGR